MKLGSQNISTLHDNPLTFFLIAGEASGDLLGARLMRQLRVRLDNKVRFVGIGGPQMVAEGLDLLFPHTELMHFGVVEVLRHVPRLLHLINHTAREVLRIYPAALITIDSPDFCFRVAKRVRLEAGGRRLGEKDSFFPSLQPPASSLPIIHYVAPTVWAWRPKRAAKIAQFLDHLLALLPFEPPYFTREGLDCDFVGHSVVEGDAANGSNAMFRAARGIAPDVPVLTVLPGSRMSEITHLLPIFRDTVDILRGHFPDVQIAVPVVAHLKERIAADIAAWGVPFHIVEGERDKYDAFAASRAALACSGTVALELALARLPGVIAYKMNALTVFLYRRFMRVRFANLVNIMHDREVVPEFLQENCTALKLADAVGVLMRDDTARQKQIDGLQATAAWLGQGEFVPSERAAEVVLEVVKRSQNDPSYRRKPVSIARDSEHMSLLPLEPQETHMPHRHAALDTGRSLPRATTRGRYDEIPAVLQILPALVTGGVERGTVEVTAALVKNGFRAFVASAGGAMVAEVESAGGVHIALPLKSKNPLTMLANIWRICRVIREQKIDIVHARSRAPAWSAYLAARRMGVPFVTTFHNAYGARTSPKRWYNSVMGKGERVIAISDFVGAYARETYGVMPDILRVIPRGVDITTFDPTRVDAERVAALRAAWNVSGGMPVILMPGRITRWKGQSVLVRALAALKRRDFICIIVGGGKDSSYGRELAQDIRAAGLDKNISIFDTCRDMAAAYRLADITVVPSTRPEGFGRVVIEAQAMGCAVIASDHGGARETVIDGETGFLTAPGDAGKLAHAIDAVLTMPQERRQALAARSIAHIRANFTTETMTAKTLAVYRELLHRELDKETIND